MSDVNSLTNGLVWLVLIAAAFTLLVATAYLLSLPLKKWDESRRRARRRADHAADLRKQRGRREHARHQLERG
jgi:hypothetical protein